MQLQISNLGFPYYAIHRESLPRACQSISIYKQLHST